MMKRLLLILAFAAISAFAQQPANATNTAAQAKDEGVALTRELELEVQLVASQEKDAQDKANALLKLVFEPITARKQELLVKACAAARLPDVNGKPGCEVRGGKVYPVRPYPASVINSEAAAK